MGINSTSPYSHELKLRFSQGNTSTSPSSKLVMSSGSDPSNNTVLPGAGAGAEGEEEEEEEEGLLERSLMENKCTGEAVSGWIHL